MLLGEQGKQENKSRLSDSIPRVWRSAQLPERSHGPGYLWISEYFQAGKCPQTSLGCLCKRSRVLPLAGGFVAGWATARGDRGDWLRQSFNKAGVLTASTNNRETNGVVGSLVGSLIHLDRFPHWVSAGPSKAGRVGCLWRRNNARRIGEKQLEI